MGWSAIVVFSGRAPLCFSVKRSFCLYFPVKTRMSVMFKYCSCVFLFIGYSLFNHDNSVETIFCEMH